MNESFLFHVAANAVLLLHVLFVAFVVFGLMLIYIGRALNWSWVRDPIFRSVHLGAIGVVTAEAWFGVVCPLTSLENTLRDYAGGTSYEGTFLSYWLRKILYYQAPDWAFVVCYTAFGVVVLASWFFVRPRSFSRRIQGS